MKPKTQKEIEMKKCMKVYEVYTAILEDGNGDVGNFNSYSITAHDVEGAIAKVKKLFKPSKNEYVEAVRLIARLDE